MNRRLLIPFITVLLLMLMLTPVTQSPTPQNTVEKAAGVADFTSKNILFDESHAANGSSLWTPGNASLFSWILGVHGYNSSTNFNDSLDSGVLINYDILVIFFPEVALSASEIAAIHSFVDAGGALLLVGVDAVNQWYFDSANLNPISEAYGVEFNLDIKNLILHTFQSHNITAGVTDLYTKGDDFWGCSLNVSEPAVSIVDYEGDSIVAAAEPGLGRVVFVSTPAPFYMYRHGTTGYGLSHFQFSLNVIDWLAENPWRQVSIPDTATIAVGDGPDLSREELLEYEAFVGAYHEHTTVSDGKNTPAEMLEQSLSIGMDFFVVTDHSYSSSSGTKGIEGALALKAISEPNNLDIEIVVGAELSATVHTAGFPMYENAWTFSARQAIDAIHAQGGIAVLCHPTISPGYGPIRDNMSEMGYDAVELTNSGFFYGGGEDGFLHNFLGASDDHGAEFLGKVLNVAFVKNPTGAKGRISDLDLRQAVLDRRIVILDRTNGLVLGQKIWVDRFMELMGDAEIAVDSARTLIDSLKGEGEALGISEAYVENAEIALEWWNPERAIELSQNATSTVALGLDLQFEFPVIIQPDVDFDLSLTLANNHTHSISVNTSFYIRESISLDHQSLVTEIPGKESTTTIRHCHSNAFGLTWYSFNMHSFNTTEYLIPLIFRNRGIVDSVGYSLHLTDGGREVVISFTIGRVYAIKVTSAVLVYDDGVKQEEVEMTEGWNTFDYSLGPYSGNIDIAFHVRVATSSGNIYNLAERTVTWTNTTTTTATTTTTTTTGIPQPLDQMLLLAIGGAGAAIVVVLLIVVLKRRGP